MKVIQLVRRVVFISKEKNKRKLTRKVDEY